MNEKPLSTQRDSAIDQLVQLLDSENGQVRKDARIALVKQGAKAIPYLVELLTNHDHIPHWEALKTLEEIEDPGVIPFLIDALDEERGDLRWIASVGLIRLGFQVAKPLLTSFTTKKTLSVFVLAGAHHIFYELNRKKKIPAGFPITELLKALHYPGRKGRLMVVVYKILENDLF